MTTIHEIDARRSRAEALMAKLYAAGATDYAMAHVLDIPEHWPPQWRKKHGLPLQPHALSAERWSETTPIRLAEKGKDDVTS